MGQKIKIKLSDGRVFEAELEEAKEKSLLAETTGLLGDMGKTLLPKEVGQWGSDFAGAYKDGKKLGKGLIKLFNRLFQRERD